MGAVISAMSPGTVSSLGYSAKDAPFEYRLMTVGSNADKHPMIVVKNKKLDAKLATRLKKHVADMPAEDVERAMVSFLDVTIDDIVMVQDIFRDDASFYEVDFSECHMTSEEASTLVSICGGVVFGPRGIARTRPACVQTLVPPPEYNPGEGIRTGDRPMIKVASLIEPEALAPAAEDEDGCQADTGRDRGECQSPRPPPSSLPSSPEGETKTEDAES